MGMYVEEKDGYRNLYEGILTCSHSCIQFFVDALTHKTKRALYGVRLCRYVVKDRRWNRKSNPLNLLQNNNKMYRASVSFYVHECFLLTDITHIYDAKKKNEDDVISCTSCVTHHTADRRGRRRTQTSSLQQNQHKSDGRF